MKFLSVKVSNAGKSDHEGAVNRMFDSLSFPDFRLYFWGQIASQTGTWMQQIAMSWLVYNLTGSVVLLGTVVFLAQIPILFLTPFSSVLADRYDRRKLLIFTQSIAMIQAALLAIMAFSGFTNIYAIMALSFMIGCVNSLDMPVRQAFYPSLVPADKLNNAIALNSTVMNASRLVGPAIGGVIIDWVGEGGCFAFNAISFLFVIGALMNINYTHPIIKRNSRLWRELKEGLLYVVQSQPIRVLLIMVVCFSFCAFNVTTFIPAYVKDTLQGSSSTLGFIMACFGIGALASALYLAARRSAVGLSRLVVVGMCMSALSMSILFFVHSLWLAVILVLLLGFGLIATIASLNTLLQTLLEGSMRGRVMGYYSMAFIGFSALGNLTWSYMSKLLGLPWAMVIGGTCCAIVALAFHKIKPPVTKTPEVEVIEVE